MSEFHVYNNIYNEVSALSQEASQLLVAFNTLEKAKISTNNVASYAGILNRIAKVLNDMQNEKASFDSYKNAIEQILIQYEKTEQRISKDAKSVKLVSAKKKDYVTDKEVDAYIAKLDKLIVSLLKFFGLYKLWKDKYEKYLEEYRLYLYDKLDVVYVIDPLPDDGKTTPPADPPETPPAEPPVTPPADPPAPPADPPAPPQPVTPPPAQPKPKPVNRDPDYSNRVFDDKGAYGARQRLDSSDKDLYAAMRQADPNLTDKQCAALIKRLGPEGCAYAGMTNIIMRAYEGRAEDFEAYFGFSMYKNGDLNYDALTAYIYARFDDPNMDGLTPGHMGDMLDVMVPEMGNNYNAEYFYEPDWNNIPNDVEHGVLAFCTQGGFSLTTTGGKVLTFDEAHYMTVTGITNDGRLIVSSWGNKYYIDPSQYSNAYYTYFTFDTIP